MGASVFGRVANEPHLVLPVSRVAALVPDFVVWQGL